MRLQLFNDIMVFLKVVEMTSFSKAAKALNVSKSIVSKNVTRLEQRLKVQLLQRSTRSLALTEAGRLLYDQCINIDRDLHEAELALSSLQEDPQGQLRVSCSAGFATWHMTEAIADFLPLYPDIKVELEIGEQTFDLIKKHVDCAIRIGKLPDSNLVARRLTTRAMRVCGSPEYFKQHGVPKTPRDLDEHNCLLYKGSPTGHSWVFQKGKEQIKVPIKGSFVSNNSQVLERAAVAGMGLVMLPGFLMIKDVKNGRLKSVLEDYLPSTIDINVVYPQTRYLAPKVRVFIDFLLERFSDSAYWEIES